MTTTLDISENLRIDLPNAQNAGTLRVMAPYGDIDLTRSELDQFSQLMLHRSITRVACLYGIERFRLSDSTQFCIYADGGGQIWNDDLAVYIPPEDCVALQVLCREALRAAPPKPQFA